jgi:hypothetical protein
VRRERMPKYYLYDDSDYIAEVLIVRKEGVAFELGIEASSFEEAVKKYVEVDTGVPIKEMDDQLDDVVLTVFGPLGNKYVTKNFTVKVVRTLEIKEQSTKRSKTK